MLEIKHHSSRTSCSKITTVGSTRKKVKVFFRCYLDDPSSDPSCSSKASDLAAGHDTPNFSIRDYVFKSRSKDIRINWPFSEQLLQLCLDNDIRDLLPPFESLSLVRARCFEKEIESVQLLKCSENNLISKNGQAEEDIKLIVSSESSDQSQNSLLERKKEFKVYQEDNIPDNKLIRSESDINVSSVKLCNYTEASSKSEVLQVSSLTTAADSMASKICPVCKSFTSSSNTTLNAHIDQCLSFDQCDVAMDVTECLKPKVKPRKKRLMVDIYTTAPHCTLEELDKRNGTNWATDLSLVAPANDTNLETKRTNISLSETVNRGSVGDIYVDSNGTKLLILSNFDDSHLSMSRKNFKLKKHGKMFKTSRTSCSIAKEKSSKTKCLKFMKINPQKKKLRGFKGFKDQIEATSKEDNTAKAHQKKDESMSQLSSAQDQVKNNGPTILGHWVCSKRSDLSRKLDGKDISKGSKKMAVNQPDSGNSSVERSCALNFSRSSEAMASSPKTKGLNILSKNQKAMGSAKKSSPQPSNLNFRLLLDGDSLSDGHMAKISSTHNESHHPSLKARRCSTSKKSTFSEKTLVSLETRKVAKSEEKLINPKKFQKHRSISGHAKCLGGEKYSIHDGGCHGSTKDFNRMSSRGNGENNDDRSNFSENQEKESVGLTNPTASILTAVPVSDINVDPSPEEHEESISRNDSQLESPSQRSSHNQEVQFCGDAIGNEIVSQDIQIISVRAISIQDPNMVVDMDSSGSPVSTISAICSPSIEEDRHMETGRSAELAPMPDYLSSRTVIKDNKVKLSSLAREPSCSCSQSLSRESHLTNHTGKKMASNLFIKTSSDLSSFRHGPSLESPTESVVTMASSKSAVSISNPSSQARVQATSNPILRLMGKDLVVSKEEPVPCDSDYYSGAKFISYGIPNHGSFSYNDYYHYPIQSTAIPQIPVQPPPQRISDKFNLSSQCSIDTEVIMIDDGSHEPRRNFTSLPQAIPGANIMASQGLFSCFASQNPYTSRAVSFRQGANSEGSFMFPSPSSLYFSPTNR